MVSHELVVYVAVVILKMEDASRVDIEPVHRAALCQRSSRSENKQEQYKKSFHNHIMRMRSYDFFSLIITVIFVTLQNMFFDF